MKDHGISRVIPFGGRRSFFCGAFCREAMTLIFSLKNYTFSRTLDGQRISKRIALTNQRTPWGGVEKRGGWKTSRMTPLPKRGFGPPLVRYVFHPPQVSVLCFSCTKIHDRADQKLFWRGPKIFGRARSLVRFPPPIRFAPPHITARGRVVNSVLYLASLSLTSNEGGEP